MGDQRGSEDSQDQNLRARAEIEGESEVFASAELWHRVYLSHYHIRTAACFARQSAAIEREHSGKTWATIYDSGLFAEHRACVTGAIFAAVAFLEATINELFADTLDAGAAGPVTDLHPEVRAKMASLWQFESVRRRGGTLEKFQAALSLAGDPKFDKGSPPYQEVADLIVLRNELIHYEPEWIVGGEQDQERLDKVSQRLRAKNFPLNLLVPEESQNPFYPDKCLGHGCAAWAVGCSVAFADQFCTRMGIPSRHDQYRPFVID